MPRSTVYYSTTRIYTPVFEYMATKYSFELVSTSLKWATEDLTKHNIVESHVVISMS